MKRFIFIFLCTILLPHCIAAQQLTLIIRVSDGQNKALPYSTAELLSKTTSARSMAADASGSIVFDRLPNGRYDFSVKSVGFDTIILTNIFLQKDTTIYAQLKPVNAMLSEVKVVATKPVYERKIDRLVFNVENSLMAKGLSTWDLFSKAPGVETSVEGAISVSTKSAAIYINDRPVKLTGGDLSNYLKNLPADNIARIEFIANPPAKYDAQGGAIINIITKKNTIDGFNGSLTSGYTRGDYNRINESINFNYRSGKFNLFGNYSYEAGKVGHDENEYVVFQTPLSYSLWNNTQHGYKNTPANNYEMGLDFAINDKNVIGLLVDGYNTSSTRTNLEATAVYNDHKPNPDSTLNTNNLTLGHINQYSYDLNYQSKLDTNGTTLTADVNYTPYSNQNNQSYNNITFLPDGSSILTDPGVSDHSTQKINIFTSKMDFSNSFRNKWRLDLGVKYTDIENDNNFSHYLLLNNVLTYNAAGSDIFDYAERTSAAYASLYGNFQKLSFQVGLRGEYTRTTAESAMSDSVNKNEYFKLFPTVFLQYPIDAKNQLNFYYGRRISRPEYWRLNPFKYYTSPYEYLVGNPSLKPSFTNSFEITETYNQNYGVAAFYNATSGVFSNITQQNNTTMQFVDTQANLGKSIQSGLYAFATFDINGWWSTDNYVRAAYKTEQSAYLQGSYDYHKVTGYFSTVEDFTLSKKAGLRAELSAWYSTPGIQGIFKIDHRYDLSTAVSKSFFSGQGNLRLSFTDMLNSNKYKLDVDYLDQKNGFLEYNDTRNLNINFTWKFGNSKVKSARKRALSGTEEKNRTSQ